MVFDLNSFTAQLIIIGMTATVTYLFIHKFNQQKIRFEIRNKISDQLAEVNAKIIDLFNLINERNKANSTLSFQKSKSPTSIETKEAKTNFDSFNKSVFEYDINLPVASFTGKLLVYLKPTLIHDEMFYYKKKVKHESEAEGDENDSEENIIWRKRDFLRIWNIRIQKLRPEHVIGQIDLLTAKINEYDNMSIQAMVDLKKKISENPSSELGIIHEFYYLNNIFFQNQVHKSMETIYSILNKLKLRL